MTDRNRILIERINYKISNLWIKGKQAESPIEVMMFKALHLILKNRIQSGLCQIIPQYEIANYRLDFAVLDKNLKIGIECDGRKFHDIYENDILRDKIRDREIVKAGFRMMRFSGTEIHSDPESCAIEVLQAIRRNVA